MCGICGFTKKDEILLNTFKDSIKHRGPDQSGIYVYNNISFGHQRLSIVDLSENGKQPMFNKDRNIIAIFNGEIYNFKEIKTKYLKDVIFKSNSDAEVIAYLYEKMGWKFVNYLEGIFAIALYDARNNELYLIRDRFGVKPLYYTVQDGILYFSSELKSFNSIGVRTDIDEDKYLEYLSLQYNIGEQTIFKDIYKLNPATILSYKNGMFIKNRYYNINNNEAGDSISFSDALYQLDMQLQKSVESRLLGDVPVGVLLSGGLDSSSIVAYLDKLKQKDIRTYSVGFGKDNDELKFASIVANKFNTNHTELMVDVNDIRTNLYDIVYTLDEPLADTGAFASYVVFKHLDKYRYKNCCNRY